MAPRFDHLKGVFGLLPTPYTDDYEIHAEDLSRAAEFCCSTGQHGVVWPVMVGEFYFLGESERIRHFETVTAAVNGRLPVVLGCTGNSVPQVLQFAEAAEKAGADAIIAMAPTFAGQSAAMDMFRRLADRYDGPIILQNAANYSPLTGEQVATLVDEIPSIEYVKEERPPGPRHISEIHRLVGDRVKTIFGGVGGRMMPEELSRGAGGCMPACQLADVLAAVMELWWKGQYDDARALHSRLLPLIVRESHPFMRYLLKRRGAFTSLVERGPDRSVPLDADDEREITILLKAIEDVVQAYPFGPELLTG